MPSEKLEVRGEMAETLRSCLMQNILMHSGFLIFEVFAYNFLILLFLSELFFIWLCYYNYMRMNSCTIYLYIVLMISQPIVGFFNLLAVGFPGGSLLYLGQVALEVYFGGVITCGHI